MISLTRSNRRRFTPSVDSLESRQLLSTAWSAGTAPITVTQGEVSSFKVTVQNSGSYKLDLKAEQSVFDSSQSMSTVWAVVVDDADPSTPVDNEIFSPTSTTSYTEVSGNSFNLQSGHSYTLYLNECDIGGSDILVQDLKIVTA